MEAVSNNWTAAWNKCTGQSCFPRLFLENPCTTTARYLTEEKRKQPREGRGQWAF